MASPNYKGNPHPAHRAPQAVDPLQVALAVFHREVHHVPQAAQEARAILPRGALAVFHREVHLAQPEAPEARVT